MLCVGLRQDGEALETGTKKFEDLEFQQLERESSLEEERETISQQLLQERAEYHSSVAKRKVSSLWDVWALSGPFLLFS